MYLKGKTVTPASFNGLNGLPPCTGISAECVMDGRVNRIEAYPDTGNPAVYKPPDHRIIEEDTVTAHDNHQPLP